MIYREKEMTATSPVQVALQIRKKYHRLQQRHSPLSATAHRLLLGKVGGGDGADATRTRTLDYTRAPRASGSIRSRSI